MQRRHGSGAYTDQVTIIPKPDNYTDMHVKGQGIGWWVLVGLAVSTFWYSEL